MIFIIAPMTAYFGWVNPPDAPDRWVFLLGRPWLFFAYLVGVVWIGAALIFASIYLLGKRRLLPVIIGHGIINTISLTAYYLSDGKIT